MDNVGKLYPITFPIPECKIIDDENLEYSHSKERWLAFIRPDRRGTYIYREEKPYYYDYRRSFFAYTSKKAGWDCMRHYEILANGCIPLFRDLDKCPENTMTHFPKQLVCEAMKELLSDELRDSMMNNNRYEQPSDCIVPSVPFTLEKYNYYRGKLLEYVREHLTTVAMVKYILNTIGVGCGGGGDDLKILFLSGLDEEAKGPDYMRCLLLHGFKELFKKNCCDYPSIVHLYSDYNDDASYKKGYGRGMTYSKNLERSECYREEWQHYGDDDIIKKIENGEYDLIVYGSLMRGLPFLDVVEKHYDPKKVVMICGEDRMGKRKWRNYRERCLEFAKKHWVFVREL